MRKHFDERTYDAEIVRRELVNIQHPCTGACMSQGCDCETVLVRNDRMPARTVMAVRTRHMSYSDEFGLDGGTVDLSTLEAIGYASFPPR